MTKPTILDALAFLGFMIVLIGLFFIAILV